MSNQMKVVLQLVKREDGQRSPVVTGTRQELADILFGALNKEDCPFKQDDYVLIVGDVHVSDDGSTANVDFSLAPLMTIQTFTSHFATKEN